MMKRTLMLVAALVFAASAAQAYGEADSNVGCGWGTAAFSGKTKKKLYALFAATTNDMMTQSFGISSETGGCTVNGGWVRVEKRQAVYAEANLQKLSAEMAQGSGEYLDAFASLMGAKDEASKKAFFTLAQQKYSTIFPAPNTDSATMLKNLRAAMAVDPKLATL